VACACEGPAKSTFEVFRTLGTSSGDVVATASPFVPSTEEMIASPCECANLSEDRRRSVGRLADPAGQRPDRDRVVGSSTRSVLDANSGLGLSIEEVVCARRATTDPGGDRLGTNCALAS
jgi:hypothetical protein